MVDVERRGADHLALVPLPPPHGRRSSFAAASVDHAAPAELQSLISRERDNILAAMAQDDVPGAAVRLLYQGKPAWVEGLGITDSDSRRRVGAGRGFSIQSTSKNFTATAIMMAVQRGAWTSTSRLRPTCRNFTVQSRFESRPQERMTLRLLLSHRAGFTHEAPIGNNYDPAFPDFETHIRSISQPGCAFLSEGAIDTRISASISPATSCSRSAAGRLPTACRR